MSMATCSYSTFVGGVCGPSKDNSEDQLCVPIVECQRDIKGHLRSLDIRDLALRTEGQLLLSRAGKEQYSV